MLLRLKGGRSDQEYLLLDRKVVRPQRRIVIVVLNARNGRRRNDFGNKNKRLLYNYRNRCSNMDMLNGALKVITFMDKGFVSTAWRIRMAMACRQVLLFLTAISFRKESNILDLTHTDMEPYHKAGR